MRSDRKKKKKIWPLILLLLLIIAAAAAYGGYNYIKNYNVSYKPGDDTEIIVTVPSGSSTTKISSILEDSGIIENAGFFKLHSRLAGLDGKYQAGEYILSASMKTDEIAAALQNAVRRDVVSFTVPEGKTLYEVGQCLVQQGVIADAEEFYAALEKDYDYSFLSGAVEKYEGFKGLSARANRLEGYLFPETYQVYSDVTAEEIISKMLTQFGKVISEYQDQITASGVDLHRIVIKASLIEREAGTDQDRPLVSDVIDNRIEKGMKLEFCSTVQFILGEYKERLLYKELEIDSPYNTYIYEGYPAGPIASPGRASIEAALNPADTDYLFFVLKADGSGSHNFASDYNSFVKYKKEYTNSL